jgi:hypothetical protein
LELGLQAIPIRTAEDHSVIAIGALPSKVIQFLANLSDRQRPSKDTDAMIEVPADDIAHFLLPFHGILGSF